LEYWSTGVLIRSVRSCLPGTGRSFHKMRGGRIKSAGAIGGVIGWGRWTRVGGPGGSRTREKENARNTEKGDGSFGKIRSAAKEE
jgi:hypothetical protein